MQQSHTRAVGSTTAPRLREASLERPPDKRRRLFPDSLASVGSGHPLADLPDLPVTSHLATPTLREDSPSPDREPSPQGSLWEDDEGRPDVTISVKETITEALLLTRHLMADRLPEDEKTVLSDPARASLLATDLDEARDTESNNFLTLPFSEAMQAAVSRKAEASR